MLELLRVIFPYLIALYMLDCISYLNKHQFVIGTLNGRRFRLRKNGINLVGLLPSSQIYLVQNLPISLAAEGMYYVPYDRLNDTGVYGAGEFSLLPYEEVEKLEIDEKSLKYRDQVIIKSPSNLFVLKLLDFLSRLNSCKSQDRPSIISHYLSKRYDIDEVGKLKKAAAPSLFYLYLSGYILFALVFITTPVAIYSDLYRYINIYLLVGYILIAYLFILFYTGRLNRKLFKPDKGIRVISFLSLVFSPINAIHASIYITKNLYHAFDLATLAAVFLKDSAFKEIARKEYFAIKKVQCGATDKSWHDYLEKKEAYLLKTIKKASCTLEEIIAPPDRQDDSAEKYCPICLAEYTQGPTRCSDCEIDLESFAS
jgi:hypothetical protein